MFGRESCTFVVPAAEFTIFMTANPEVRAQPRYAALITKGDKVTLDEIEQNILLRDYTNSNIQTGPFRNADDVIVFDNSNITPEEQL